MERTLSVEEKIRKAEEIYNKRNSQTSQYNIYENKSNREYKFFNKIIVQLIICLFIYLVSYIIINNQYVFSEDFKNKINEIMKYDIEIQKINEFINSQIQNLKINNNNNSVVDNNTVNNNTIDNGNETSSEDSNTQGSATADGETQEEKDIREINEKISFIVPVVGVVTSRFGTRNPTTPSVPTYHTGIDIAAQTGTDILSATNGKVVQKSEEGDYRKTYKSFYRGY